jgi:hypothetical protein
VQIRPLVISSRKRETAFFEDEDDGEYEDDYKETEKANMRSPFLTGVRA